MTWTKLSDDFTEDAARARLSDAAFRTHVEGLVWVMRRETGGVLDEYDLRRALESRQAEQAVPELVAAGWWVPEGSGFRVIRGMEHQPEPEVMERRRQADAERQRRKRLKAAGIDPETGEVAVSRRDTPRDNTRDPGRDGTGRGGAGRGSIAGTEVDDDEAAEALRDYRAGRAGDPAEILT